MPEPVINVREVSKLFRLYDERNQSLKATVMRGRRARYEEFWALQDVSFDIPAGSTFGIIGENGSGKSTLLKCIARILYPEKGKIETRGKISALLELGAGFHPELSGRENVYLNGSILGMSRRQINERLDDIVEFAGLERFIDAPVKNYSSGMYVRLGFSVAINVDPEILLIDEVLSVGDADFQQRCFERLVEFCESGRTVVIVSHALGSLRSLCDHAAFLEHGVLRSVGPAAEVVDLYRGETHHDRVLDGAHGTRWGSGEARIESVELLNARQEDVRSVHTGEQVTVCMHYEATQVVERPVFGIQLKSVDGIEVTGPNLRDAELVPEKIEGSGTVAYRIPKLMLLPGTYDLTVGIFDYALNHAYDCRDKTLRFDVEFGMPHEEAGLVSLGGSWEFATEVGTE